MSDSTPRPDPPSAPHRDAPRVVTSGEIISPTRNGGPAREIDGRKVMARLVGVVARVPRYVKLGWLLMNEPTVSGKGKVALGGGLAYAISPIDPVPGIIPVLGQLDDLAVLLLSVRMALKSAPEEVATARLEEAGLSWETLERDLVTIRATAIWLARRGGALAAQAAKAMFSMAAGRLRDRLGRLTGSRADSS